MLLDWIISSYYRGKYSSCDIYLVNAIRIALYQILFLDRIPDSAAVNESVEFLKRHCGIPAGRTANGILRNFLRNRDDTRYPDKSDNYVKYLSVIYSHPEWLVKRFIELFGTADTEKLLKRNNEIPPTSIRVNTLKFSLQELLAYLQENDIAFLRSPWLENTILITDRNFRIASSDIFREGNITIQDTSATLVATLAAAKPQTRILDLCAAPGGKSFFLAEATGDSSSITALDKFPIKLQAMQNEIDRLAYKSIHPTAGDAREFRSEVKYDLILCDVPCSGLGVISKKPDIKWRRTPQEIDQMLALQQQILNHASELVSIGGAIIYSTCTIEAKENYDNIAMFLAGHPDFEIEPAENFLPKEICKDGMMQTFPHLHDTDGAFAVRLIKKKEA